MERLTYIDTHAHLPMLTHDPLETILKRAEEAGVTRMVTVATEQKNWASSQECAQRFSNVFFTLGLHPHEAADYADCAAQLEKYFPENRPPEKCVAIGEIGMDFFYDHSPKDLQIAAFEAQLTLANRVGLPVVIHCRNAFPELFASLRRVGLGPRKGVMHCFTGNRQEALEALDLGFYISMSGIVTFKKADELRDAAQVIPLDRLLIETDCPFLAPLPHRGKPNEPSFLPLTASSLATTLGRSLQEISLHTTRNAIEFFQL